ncbi:carotenoid oxygenase family protein [Glycocaulis sp.]|uniref:carotenoid oxygenase family protein n=1 Tax=Glycocaulis sp. TaxID=1969725 RepID=UPI0025BF136F|nr:carotenoid oxygenase family protein [Glycocaulis sp.]MCH8521606.1 carotenoid oxygenase family protein [Glycocaulis sp.]
MNAPVPDPSRRMERDAPSWLSDIDNAYLRGLYAPVAHETTANELKVIGEIPADLCGAYMRNGPNQVYAPKSKHHWFDGDGMVHTIAFKDGKASYRSRFVRTAHFNANAAKGEEQWPGYMGHPDPNAPPGAGSDGWLKDSGNTDLILHNGEVLALWYQAGVPVRLDPATGETLGEQTWGGALTRQVSAHAKTDPVTGELFFFDYNTKPPYMTYHVVSREGQMIRNVPIDVPGPRLPHDMAMTENYAILHDLPLFWDPELLPRGIHKVTFYPDMPSRFGIIPKYGKEGDVRWFEAEPCYIYHVTNSWEEGDWIIMEGCRVTEPCPESKPGQGMYSRMMAFLLLKARFHRWKFNLKTGETREEWLDDRNAEFPTVNMDVAGRKSRYSYHVSIPLNRETMVFDGLIKFDTQTGSSQSLKFKEGWYGSESPFAPRLNSNGDEDDGYLITFITNEEDGQSECHIIDAKDIEKGPVARVILPSRVPAGFHSTWVPGTEMGWA